MKFERLWVAVWTTDSFLEDFSIFECQLISEIVDLIELSTELLFAEVSVFKNLVSTPFKNSWSCYLDIAKILATLNLLKGMSESLSEA